MQTGLRPVCVRSATQTATPGGISIAIFHLSVKVVSRSTGRSATAAAAYRCGIAITDSRTGLLFDYRRKKGVVHTELVLPANAPFWAADRERLWNEAERAEHRRNSTVAREFVIALPENCPLINAALLLWNSRTSLSNVTGVLQMWLYIPPGATAIREFTMPIFC